MDTDNDDTLKLGMNSNLLTNKNLISTIQKVTSNDKVKIFDFVNGAGSRGMMDPTEDEKSKKKGSKEEEEALEKPETEVEEEVEVEINVEKSKKDEK
eukprot:CAMPEP_0114591388 /NCGR_PEP_ID=MMETSP0125-20121206/13442_1 /TAXON_ID=485358 ORGANISM="Aristerostoma sp., Strain ATCC 50986" /NCGR_SAMPLE_ID=MMETSP0125 /ASSEMBLY_ACC=CAM_ASM_000245 /LENGTH=96 /DNA_ID=CAMNT_0001789437 /DNA_START=5358 /DNA_END=5648 /DNA_ORIENTATION=-